MPEKDEHDFALAIGRLVLQCARLEHELIYHTAGLLNATNGQQEYEELKKAQPTVVIKKFKALIKSRTPASHDSLRERLSCIASDAEHLVELRNALVHSVWVPVKQNAFPYGVREWNGKRHSRKQDRKVDTANFKTTEVAKLHSQAKDLREQLIFTMHYAFTNCSELFEMRP
jgi:hypothetical protein